MEDDRLAPKCYARKNATGIPILSQPATEIEIVPQTVGQLPWFHNVILVEQLKDPAQRRWYAEQTLIQGWSRTILEHQIESKLYSGSGKAVTNFAKTIPAPDSDLVQQLHVLFHGRLGRRERVCSSAGGLRR